MNNYNHSHNCGQIWYILILQRVLNENELGFLCGKDLLRKPYQSKASEV